MGATLGVSFLFALVMFLTLVVVTIVTDYIAIGTIATSATATALIMGNIGVNPAGLIYASVGLVILIKHIPNFKRIASGEEKRFLKSITNRGDK
jgi:glycerol-3-phosphate acyltransferase PlsY